MSLRLVISDLDGTLVDDHKNLTDATVAAVKRLTQAGVPFTVISARPQSGIDWIAERLGLILPYGAFNGGTLIAAGTVTERHVLDREVVAGIFALAEGSGAEPWLFVDGRWHARNATNPHTGPERRSAGQPDPVIVADMTPLYGDVDKLSWVDDDASRLEALEATCVAAFGTRATIARSQPYYLDVTHPKANKGDGIVALARAAGVDLADVAVLGDQRNDLPMFARAGLSIAMGQGPADVRAAATHVTLGNDRDGVAHAIDTILIPLIEGQS